MDTTLSVMTNFKFAKSQFDKINSMTYFFNPNWTNENNFDKTAPVVFFYLLSFRELKKARVNTEPLILYDNSNGAENMQRAFAGQQRVIADNIVAEPETYELECIIPYTMFSMDYFNSFNNVNRGDSFYRSVNDIFNNILVKSLFKTIGAGLRNVNTDSWFNSITETLFVENRTQINSVKEMFNNKLPIQMKLPYGWKFTNGIITDLEIEKKSDEEKCVNAKINLMIEPPIMRVITQDTKALKAHNWYYYEKSNQVLYNIFNQIGGSVSDNFKL